MTDDATAQIDELRREQADLAEQAKELRDRRRDVKQRIDELEAERQEMRAVDAAGNDVSVEARPAEAGVERG